MSPAVHAIETFALTFVTGMMMVHFTVFLLVLWADRPITGRDEHGRLRVLRDVRGLA